MIVRMILLATNQPDDEIDCFGPASGVGVVCLPSFVGVVIRTPDPL